MKRRRRQNESDPTFDMTPMIDCVFQLLIFFIVCTRFITPERNHRADLPTDEGLSSAPAVPKEQITIYCLWEPESRSNQYTVAIGARGRRIVENSRAGLEELVIFPLDDVGTITSKKRKYAQLYDALLKEVESYITRSGAKIEKIELSFARDAVQGVKSGTAPWLFVSLGLDVCAQLNKNRKAAGQETLSITFKFADAFGRTPGAKK